MTTALQIDMSQLDELGYTVVPGFLDLATTARIRDHIDSLLPPPAPLDDEKATRLHVLRHPIPGAIMAEILLNPDLLQLATLLLAARDLRLTEQVLIRTDPAPPPHGARGWHVDWSFLPQHYAARPRQTYFHMVHALNTVAPGGGAFTIVPGSQHLTGAAAVQALETTGSYELNRDPSSIPGVDLNNAVEVCPNEGDLIIFNPMAVHSASKNSTPHPRYVYFASFFDASATDLHAKMRRDEYRNNFPDSLRDALPAEFKSLLDH